MIKDEYSSEQTNDTKISGAIHDSDKIIQNFEIDTSTNGFSNLDYKAQESQLSTTGGFTNMIMSSSIRQSTSVGREENRDSAQKTDEENFADFQSEVKILDEAVKRIENLTDIAAMRNSEGYCCYPTIYNGSMVIAFEENGDCLDHVSQSEKIVNEIANEESEVQAKCLEYLQPNDLDTLRDHTYWGYYIRYPDFLLAVKNMFLNRIKRPGLSGRHKWYLGYMYSIYLGNLVAEKHSSKFYADQGKDMEMIVNHWKEWKVSCSTFPRIPRCSRQYLEINQYEPAVS